MMRIVLAVFAVVIAATVASILAASSRWNRTTVERAALLAAPRDGGAYHEAIIDGLPAPAVRYFRRVLREGQPMVHSARATQQAEFFLNRAWRPLKATQQFAANPPGFVWDARIQMAPMLSALVRDSYVNGNASMTASVLGVYSLVDQRGAPELNAGALQRLLGEAVWLPTFLLPSDRITWTPRDDRSAVVTLCDSDNEVALTFEIDDDGHPVEISGDRFKEAGGRYSIQPWRIRCEDFRERDGMVIPVQCEVAWMVNGVAEPYWRGRVTSITYGYN